MDNIPERGLALARHDWTEIADEDHIFKFRQGKYYEYSIDDDIVTVTSDEMYVRITMYRFKKHFDTFVPVSLDDEDCYDE